MLEGRKRFNGKTNHREVLPWLVEQKEQTRRYLAAGG